MTRAVTDFTDPAAAYVEKLQKEKKKKSPSMT